MLNLKNVIGAGLIISVIGLSSFNFAAEVSTHAELPGASNDFVTVDSEGNIFVSNVGNWIGGGFDGTSIFKVNSDGTTETYSSSILGPIGNAVDSAGNLYVSNYNSGDVINIETDGTTTIIANLGGPQHTGGIAVNSNDEIFVADFIGNRVFKMDSDGNEAIVVEGGNFNGPTGLAFDENDNLYIANYNDGKLFRLDTASNLSEISQQTDGNNIGHIAYADGAVYATGLQANKIYKMSLTCEVEELEGTESTNFSQPNGIGASADRTMLYVTEFGNSNKLYAIDLTKSGSGGGGSTTQPPTTPPPVSSGGGSTGIWLVLLPMLLLGGRFKK